MSRPNIVIATQENRPIAPAAVRQLYTSVNWWPARQEHDIASVLARDVAVGAWDGDVLVGFARAVSDGAFRAYIEDVVVHPEYRHLGIGSQIIAVLLERLVHIETISLFCEPELITFYERHGFRARNTQVVMHRKP